MSSMRPVLSFTYARLARAPLAAWLLAASAASFGQAAPAVSTVFAFNGSSPNGGLVLGSDGALYGTTASENPVSGGLIYRSTTNGSSVTSLHQMAASEGTAPRAGLLKGSDGLLYGTTQKGEQLVANTSGTTFRLAADGTEFTILHRFQPWTNVNGRQINDDGAYPQAELIEGSDGYIYGVTSAGGANGTGVIFRHLPDGTGFSVLHEFAVVTSAASATVITNADGAAPTGSLVQAPDGFLYGTASAGGVTGRGTIFRVGMNATGLGFQVVHVFTDLSSATPATNVDGARPTDGLTDGHDGLLYGVASLGGANGVGTLFSLDPTSGLLTVLHDFETANGANPAGALVLGSDTRLYGVTSGGGTNSSGATTTFGTIYSIARDGTGFTKLHSFDGTNGSGPSGALLQLDPTTFAGITLAGGKCGQGTLFSYSSTGATVAGNTTCGQKKKNQSGGGSVAPGLLLLLSALGLAARRRRD